VLAVLGFIAFWVVLAFGLFFVASRGGPGGARAALQRQTRGANRFALFSFVVVAIVFGIAMPLVFLTGNHSNASAQVGGIKLNAAQRSGRELFGTHCAVCHTLAAANAIGKVGPNLDTLKPSVSVILHTINNGCLPNAPSSSAQQCLGYGVMPADVVQGVDAQDVASFVAKVAGKE
jgi:mono/diheme cytochrome c family protein